MRNRTALGLALLLALLLAGGAAAGAAEKTVRELASGQQSGIRTARRAVVRTEAEWKKLWAEHQNARTGRSDPPPQVDWTKEMVVAVFMGEKPTGGYAVSVKDAREEKGKLAVAVVERVPGPGAITIQVLTAPFHMVAVKRSGLAVEWKTEAPPAKAEPPAKAAPPAKGTE
jgi:hypothetical protein